MRHMKMFLSKGHKLSMSSIKKKAGSKAGSVTMGYGKFHGMKKPKAPPAPPKPPKAAARGR